MCFPLQAIIMAFKEAGDPENNISIPNFEATANIISNTSTGDTWCNLNGKTAQLYFCGNRKIQRISLCLTSLYGIKAFCRQTNTDMNTAVVLGLCQKHIFFISFHNQNEIKKLVNDESECELTLTNAKAIIQHYSVLIQQKRLACSLN